MYDHGKGTDNTSYILLALPSVNYILYERDVLKIKTDDEKKFMSSCSFAND